MDEGGEEIRKAIIKGRREIGSWEGQEGRKEIKRNKRKRGG